MKLQDYKLLLIVVGLIGIMLLASSTLVNIVRPPVSEPFSELFILGPGRMAENYPHNIVPGQNYSFYVGVSNHLGYSALYMVYLKMGNQTDLLPNATSVTPSPLKPLTQYEFSLFDNQTWEMPLTFSMINVSTTLNQTTINKLAINDVTLNISKSAVLDPKSGTFSYKLICELWLYNGTINAFQYNNRFVSLQLSVT